MFAEFLSIVQQPATERRVLARGAPARRRAGQRLGKQPARFHPQQPLGTRPDEALAAPVRKREGIAVGETLPQTVENS